MQMAYENFLKLKDHQKRKVNQHNKIFYIEAQPTKPTGTLDEILTNVPDLPFEELWAEFKTPFEAFLPKFEVAGVFSYHRNLLEKQLGFKINKSGYLLTLCGISIVEQGPLLVDVEMLINCKMLYEGNLHGQVMKEIVEESYNSVHVKFDLSSHEITVKEVGDRLLEACKKTQTNSIQYFGNWAAFYMKDVLSAIQSPASEYSKASYAPRQLGVPKASITNRTPSQVIIVRAKNTLQTESSFCKNYKTEFTHGWWVRGHWRKVMGIGKNRVGERSVIGMTWVIPHSKKLELGVVEKIRLIKEPLQNIR